jgi:hypothetical protein
MNRRSIRLLSVLLGIGFAAILLAGCNGTAPTASPTARPTLRSTATPAATDTSAPQPSGSVVPSASPSAAASLPLPHFDAALEAKLPDSIGGVTLEKLSWPLSTYIASLKGGGDSVLYAPWLVQFGKNADDIHMAIASDLTDTENFTLQAIQVPGVNSTALIGGFEASAQKQGWPVGPAVFGTVSVIEIVDPVAAAAGANGTAYIYGQGDIMYIVITDDNALVVEALAKTTS